MLFASTAIETAKIQVPTLIAISDFAVRSAVSRFALAVLVIVMVLGVQGQIVVVVLGRLSNLTRSVVATIQRTIVLLVVFAMRTGPPTLTLASWVGLVAATCSKVGTEEVLTFHFATVVTQRVLAVLSRVEIGRLTVGIRWSN